MKYLGKDIDTLNESRKNTLVDALGIVFTEVKQLSIAGMNQPIALSATMPVNNKTRQPMGILHGGASLVLAESLGSVASWLIIDEDKYFCVGMEINANHIKPALEGQIVNGTAYPLHLGQSTHVWDIKIYIDKKELICVSRMTVKIMTKFKR